MINLPEPSGPDLGPDNYINRELSTLNFQRRVLALADDDDTPLLERIKYCAIVGNNLDEFFMVRVAAYFQKLKLGLSKPRPDGFSPQQLLKAIRHEVTDLMSEQRRLIRKVLGLLRKEGVFIAARNELLPEERDVLRQYFMEAVFPVLTPLAADHARPFPFISNLSLNLGVYLRREQDDDDEEPEFARIKMPVPDVLPRLVNINRIYQRYTGREMQDSIKLIWIEDIVFDNLEVLFPGMEILEACPFRVLRNADIDYEHEREEEDLLDVMSIIEQSVRERRFGSVVRVSVPDTISSQMMRRIYHGLEVRSEADVYLVDGALGSANLFELAGIDRPDLKYPTFVPRMPDIIAPDQNIFTAIRRQDIILHHPYDSFSPVEEFFRVAAHDPNVLAIKATLYRVGKNSPIVNALMAARDNEKQVTVLVELKARFDEENNLEWARALESKGVHVIYGVEELPVKTHAKISLVVRREPDGVRRYVHLGTGNYNASTARLYTDMGLFTCDEEIADDATRLFNRLTGYAPMTHYKRLMVAPEYLLPQLITLIDQEIAAARAGKDARIIFKMNQLEEDRIIQKLYEASQAGVKIDLIVRGLCCLVPGLPGLSETVRVISVVGRFLEHSRIYYFQNAPENHQICMGSADVMRRNLYNRVEVVFPILDERIRTRVMRLLLTSLLDNAGSWELHNDGRYHRLKPMPGEKEFDSQHLFTQNSFGLKLRKLDVRGAASD